MLLGKGDGHKGLSFTREKEISKGIIALGDEDMAKAVGIIRNWCPSQRKYIALKLVQFSRPA